MWEYTSSINDFTSKERKYRSIYKMEFLNWQDTKNSAQKNGMNGLVKVIDKPY